MGGIDPALQSRLNKLIDDMQRELEFEKRAKISREIEFILYNEHLTSAPFGWQNLFHGTQPWVRGWWAHNQAIHTGHIKIWERTWTVR
jgi:ABC-type transport system substrate-binding protein